MFCKLLLCVCLLWDGVLTHTLFFEPMGKKIDSEREELKVSMETGGEFCIDQKTICSSSQTCCKLSDGVFGCCQYPKAVCCGDMKHCCPQNYTCDMSHGKCIENKHTDYLPWLEHTLSRDEKSYSSVNSVVCPDGQTQCPDGSTCCKLSSGQYGCCPLPKAVCCSDHTHCCPSGTTCDTSQGKCNRGEESFPWLKKQPAMPRVTVGDVVCPDGQSQCPDGSTCCKLSSGQYGCCPLPQAVCCSDHTHCCPSGTTCDVSQGKCNRGEESIPWVKKQPSMPRVSVGTVVCPDGQSQCPDGSTCCKLSSGQYGCCPFPKAMCCSDHLHCCPSGMTCDVEKGSCKRGYSFIHWREPELALPRDPLLEVICPDGHSECPNGSTCCKMTSGEYGCCPLPEAVCCLDHLHCCPSRTVCHVRQGKCTHHGGETTPWVAKTPAIQRIVKT